MPFWDSKRAIVAGSLAAVGASVCCVGPLLLLMLGIGGTWATTLVAFDPYRPIFIGLTVLFFGLAYVRLYEGSKSCDTAKTCATPAVLKRQRTIFWIIAALVLGLIAAPLAAPLLL